MNFFSKKFFAGNVRDILAKQNHTQSWLAGKMGVKQAQLSQWIKEKNPRLPKKFRLGLVK